MQSSRLIHTITPDPVWNLVLGWVMVIPLLFLSANGSLIPGAGDVSLAASPTSAVPHKAGVALVTLICSILIASRLSHLLSVCRQTKVLLALPVLAIFSSVWSVQPRQSLISGVILLVFTVFALYVGTRFSFQQQFELIMLVGAVALPLSIALALFVPDVGAAGGGWNGVFGRKQNCAAVSMFWLITALHWRGSGLYQKTFRMAYILMCIVLIFMSQSRTGWALTLIALFLSATLWVMQKMPAKESLLMILIGLVVAAGLGYAVHNYLAVVVTAVGKDTTLSQRTSIWAAVWREIIKRPILGYGFSAFWKGLYGASYDVVLSSGWDLFQAQDGFLDIWLGIGFFGVALVATMAMQSMRNAIRSFRAYNERYVRWCIVVTLCTLLYNIGESSIGGLQMVWFLFLLAYIGLKQTALRERLA